MGAHLYLCGRALAFYRGERLEPLQPKFVPMLDGAAGSSNMIALAVTTECARNPSPANTRRVDRWLWDQNNDGLWCAYGRCEQLAPFPHGGMNLLALMLLADIGHPGAVELVGKVARLLRLLSTPDGAYAGPGIRADNGAYNGWATDYDAWLRAAMGLPHRGANGNPRALTGKKNALVPNTDDLTPATAAQYLPAIWLEQLIAEGKVSRRGIAAGNLPTLRLPVTVRRWNSGHVAYMEDPGPEKRARYRTEGSAQANREGDAEDVTSAVRCVYGRPGKHAFESVLTWCSDPPTAPEGAREVTIGRAG